MIRDLAFMMLAASAVMAQTPPVASVKVASTNVPENPSRVTLTILHGIENGLDGRLGSIDINRPVQNLRDAFAIYLSGYGVAITTELDILATPFNSPMAPKITPEIVAQVHKQKLERLPVVLTAMKDEMRHAASSLEGRMPDGEVIILVARVHYWLWEDVTDLPRHQIILQASRKAASMGDIKTVFE